MESMERDKTRDKLLCPKCQILYEMGNYCRRCGSLLVKRTEFQETDGQPLEKGLVKRWSKEWLKLSTEKTNVEVCLSKLETQQDKVSKDVFQTMLDRYQEQLESLSSLHREIEAQLESAKKTASEEIGLLEKELMPIQKRLEEIRSLYQSGAMTKADFSKEKGEMKREIRSREKRLRKYQQIISLLPSNMGGGMTSPRSARDLLRPFPLIIAGGVLILVMVGGYFFWQRGSQSGDATSREIATPSSNPSSSPSRPPVTEGQEIEKIKALFENIKRANLRKDINLFMSCYSRDFKDRKGKQTATLESWDNFNYLDLSYDFKKQTISGDSANLRVEWLIRISRKVGGQPQDSRSILDVTLRREEGSWKIKEIKSVS